MKKKEENISVAVRVRPLLKKEHQQGMETVWDADEKAGMIQSTLQVNSNGYSSKQRNVEMYFDHVFGPGASNSSVYECVAENIVWSTMEGFNGTIFAYGQTNAGKTYTMKGSKQNPGVIPLAIQDVFSYIKQTPEREFLLRVSYLEIYNEIINDLLCPQNSNLKIHESEQDGVYVEKLKEEIVLSPAQVMSIISAGEAHRHVGATNFNELSSRSHTIFRMIIESKPVNRGDPGGPGGAVRVSTLNLIDLAGSEKAGPKGVRTTEGGYINKSLLTLGNVISKLSEDKGGHIPYRDSKLTRILSQSLSGNARIAIICTVSPTQQCFEETHNTLKFANRAKQITNKAKLNEVLDDKALIKKYRTKINMLLKKLEEVKKMETEIEKLQQAELDKKNLEESNATLVKRLYEQEAIRISLEEKISRLTKLILVSTSIGTPAKLSRRWRGSARSPAAYMMMREDGSVRGLNEPISPRHPVRRTLDFPLQENGNGFYGAEDSDEDEDAELPNGNIKETFRVFKTRKGKEMETPKNPRKLQSELEEREDKIASMAESINKLQSRVAAMEEETALLKLNEGYLNQQVRDRQRDVACKDLQILQLQQQLLEKEEWIQKLAKSKEQEYGAEVLSSVMAQMHANQISKLREQALDAEIQAEVLKADSYYMMQSLEEKDDLIREWAEFFEHFEHKQRLLEEELAKVKSNSRKAALAPKYFSDGDAM